MNAIVHAWERTVLRRRNDYAVVEAVTGASCTFEQLAAGANAWQANYVADAPLVGRVVVYAVPNGIRWLEMFVALLRAGAVVAPLDAAEPVAAQRRVATALRAAYWWNGAILEALPAARRLRDRRICVIKLTSGTTGEPRPLAFTDAQMLADAAQVTSTMRIGPRDVNYALIPLGHSYGLGNLTLPLLARGVPLVCGAAPLPQAIANDVTRWKPTVFPTVPAVLRALAAADLPRDAFASLRTVISAGAPLPPPVARDFAARFGRRVHSFYGSSETGGIAYDRTGSATLAGGVGQPLRGVEVKPRRGGRMIVISAAVFTLGNPRKNGRQGGWSPPDHVSIDERNNITLLGRRGRVVKIAGRRVNLAEVAKRLRRIPGVRDVWAGVDGAAEPVLGAAVVTARSTAELRADLVTDTAPWKVPKRWALLAELPVTGRGKLDTLALHAAVFR